MKKRGLVGKLAKGKNISQAKAADLLDQAVGHILRKLRNGERVNLPGVGVLKPGPSGQPQFEPATPQVQSKGRKQPKQQSSKAKLCLEE